MVLALLIFLLFMSPVKEIFSIKTIRGFEKKNQLVHMFLT